MASKHKVLFDANVVLDVLTKREPHYAKSWSAWALVEQRQVIGFLAAHSVTTIYYLVAKNLNRTEARSAIKQLTQVFQIATVDQAVIHQALTLEWPDFEDAVQMAAALNVNADYLLSRNPTDFKDTPIPVLSPLNFLNLHTTKD